MVSPHISHDGPFAETSSKNETNIDPSTIAVEQEEQTEDKQFRRSITHPNHQLYDTSEDYFHLFIPHFPMGMGVGPQFVPESILDVVKKDLEDLDTVTTKSATTTSSEYVNMGNYTQSYTHQLSQLELLPQEIFDHIIPYLFEGGTTGTAYRARNKDLISCLCVSNAIHAATINTMIRNVVFTQSSSFSKFLRHIQQYPHLGDMVRRLDFSRFTSVGLGRSAHMNSVVTDLTSTTLVQCLKLIPRLQEFLACEHLEKDFSPEVIEQLFCKLPYLVAIDLCAASSSEFTNAMSSVLHPNNELLPEVLPIQRLGLHDCATLPVRVLETILPRLPHLTHLDLSHTPVTDSVLGMIHTQAKITHLSLSKCMKLTGAGVVEFLTTHPAVKDSLVHLNLYFDPTRSCLLQAEDVATLLPLLPASLVSLNISGAAIFPEHLGKICRLLPQLEELSLGGAKLSLDDLNILVAPERKSKVKYLDLAGVVSITPGALLFKEDCALLCTSSQPLQAIEFSQKLVETLGERPQTYASMGWNIRTKGRRGWLVRKGPLVAQEGKPRVQKKTPLGLRRNSNENDLPEGVHGVCSEDPADDGYRKWKMGDRYWGARKVSCTWANTAGIYAYYGYGKL